MRRRFCRPIIYPDTRQPADSRLPNRCEGAWLPRVDAVVEPERMGHRVGARRVFLRRALTDGAIAASEVVSEGAML